MSARRATMERVLLRYAAASLGCATLDNLVFWLAYRVTGLILVSQIVARLISLMTNYWLARAAVFRSPIRHADALPRYLALAAANLLTSWAGIHILTALTPLGVLPSKIAVESLLFIANFAVQRRSVFLAR